MEQIVCIFDSRSDSGKFLKCSRLDSMLNAMGRTAEGELASIEPRGGE
jgi:hypothetical protein